jgi:hypothetical protein
LLIGTQIEKCRAAKRIAITGAGGCRQTDNDNGGLQSRSDASRGKNSTAQDGLDHDLLQLS